MDATRKPFDYHMRFKPLLLLLLLLFTNGFDVLVVQSSEGFTVAFLFNQSSLLELFEVGPGTQLGILWLSGVETNYVYTFCLIFVY